MNRKSLGGLFLYVILLAEQAITNFFCAEDLCGLPYLMIFIDVWIGNDTHDTTID